MKKVYVNTPAGDGGRYMSMNKHGRVIKIIDMILNPLILWSYGWKRHKVDWNSPLYDSPPYHIRWEDPNGTGWWTQEDAIMICEKRL